MTFDELRRATVTRNFRTSTTLQEALDSMGFVQADPIRAPARAQDLILRHRVSDYRAGDLERHYANLAVHEDFFVNYGFVSGQVSALMHPRGGAVPWTPSRGKHVRDILAFVRRRGAVHPREVDQHFAHGRVTNYWGGSSNATTHLLTGMHYRGLLRVVRREAGIRIYAAHEHDVQPRGASARRARLDALVDVIVRNYAPLPAASLSHLVSRLRYAVPQWRGELAATLRRAKHRLANARINGLHWYWAPDDLPAVDAAPDVVRVLAPFDPLVWDRRRFEMLWGWAYRFEAYTPVAKRKLGYYALPLLWRDQVIGWANLSVADGALTAHIGYVAGRPPRERAFRRALDDELDRVRLFLGLHCRLARHRRDAVV